MKDKGTSLLRLAWPIAAYCLLLTACGPASTSLPHEKSAPEPPAASPDAATDQPVDTAESLAPETAAPAQPSIAITDSVPASAAETLKSTLNDKDAFADKLWKTAGTIDDQVHLGTSNNEIHVNEHSCHILGQLVGREAAVAHLVITYEPDYGTATPENAFDLRLMSQSLSNYVYLGKSKLEMSRDELILEWNIDCAGAMGIPRSAYVAQDGASAFYLVKNNGKLLQILGDIEADFAAKVIRALQENPGIDTVALGSGGGHVYEALRAGEYIRAEGLSTILWNGCYSACPLVFVAGRERSIMSPYPDLGFHQIYTPDGQAIPFDSQTYRDIHAYLLRMGIDARYVIQKMWSAAPSEMTMVDGNEVALCDANVATWIQRGCTSPHYRSHQ